MAQIKVEFDLYGNTRVDALGFTGNSCVEATAYVEAALAGQKTKDDSKPEMFAPGGTTTEEANLRF